MTAADDKIMDADSYRRRRSVDADPGSAMPPSWLLSSDGAAPTVGRGLVAVTGILLVVGSVPLALDARSWAVVGTVAGWLVLLAAATVRMPWRRHPRTTVAFPLATLTGLGAVGLAADPAGPAFTGIISLCFVYVGLFHRLREAAVMLPFAIASYLTMVTLLSTAMWVRLAISAVAWLGTSYVLTQAVGHLRVLNHRLTLDVRADPLTGLGNRRALDERLAAALPGDAVVFLDLDHFKELNDGQGHDAGDAVLVEFGQTVRSHVSRRDTVTRYGGDELVLLLTGESSASAPELVERIRATWMTRVTGSTFSAGVAYVGNLLSPSKALLAADAALYQAKRAGRDTTREHGLD